MTKNSQTVHEPVQHFDAGVPAHSNIRGKMYGCDRKKVGRIKELAQ